MSMFLFVCVFRFLNAHTPLPRRSCRPFQVSVMIVVFVALLTVNLLKGGGAFDSPVGIECGSFAFWATSVLSFLYLVAVSLCVMKPFFFFYCCLSVVLAGNKLDVMRACVFVCVLCGVRFTNEFGKQPPP